MRGSAGIGRQAGLRCLCLTIDVRVQVPSPAPNPYNPNQLFLIGEGFGLLVYFEKFEDTHFRNGLVKRPESKPRGPRKKKLHRQHKRAHLPLVRPLAVSVRVSGTFRAPPPALSSILQTPADLLHFRKESGYLAEYSGRLLRFGGVGSWCWEIAFFVFPSDTSVVRYSVVKVQCLQSD